MNILLIIALIAAGLFLLCIELTVCMIVSRVCRRRKEKAVGWSIPEALEGLQKLDIKPWEVDT